MNGQLMLNQNLVQRSQIDINHLNNGIYILTINTNNKINYPLQKIQIMFLFNFLGPELIVILFA